MCVHQGCHLAKEKIWENRSFPIPLKGSGRRSPSPCVTTTGGCRSWLIHHHASSFPSHSKMFWHDQGSLSHSFDFLEWGICFNKRFFFSLWTWGGLIWGCRTVHRIFICSRGYNHLSISFSQCLVSLRLKENWGHEIVDGQNPHHLEGFYSLGRLWLF